MYSTVDLFSALRDYRRSGSEMVRVLTQIMKRRTSIGLSHYDSRTLACLAFPSPILSLMMISHATNCSQKKTVSAKELPSVAAVPSLFLCKSVIADCFKIQQLHYTSTWHIIKPKGAKRWQGQIFGIFSNRWCGNLADNRQVKRLRETLRMLVRRLGILERSEASCCGITFAQCHILVDLGRARKQSVNDLAEALRLDKSTVSRSVDNLVNTGLVLREPDPADRRYVALRLSEQGGQIVADLEQRMENYFAEIIDVLPAEKREQVLESLLLLVDAVRSPKCCDMSPGSCAGKER